MYANIYVLFTLNIARVAVFRHRGLLLGSSLSISSKHIRNRVALLCKDSANVCRLNVEKLRY